MASESLESPVMVPSTPPPQSTSSNMTPPPSTQPPKPDTTTAQHNPAPRPSLPQSPPLTVSATLFTVPGTEDIANAEPEDLRNLVQDLTKAVQDARASAAHWKLQHTFLTLESRDAAERAEVEHGMTRREVEVLAARNHGGLSNTPQTSQQSRDTCLRCKELEAENRLLEAEIKELEAENAEVERRLDTAKKLIEKETDRAELFSEQIVMLRRRIRENRQHFNMMRRSPFFHTLASVPQDFSGIQQHPAQQPAHQVMEPPRSHVNNRSQDPFAALLAADQVLSGEAASMPATPTRNQPSNPRHGHTRGAFSLSSLQITPDRLQPERGLGPIPQLDGDSDRFSYSVPNKRVMRTVEERDKRDRDSTISVSEEEALTDEDLPQSQASSLATNMLRRNPGSQDGASFSGKVEKSSKVLQSKLFGQVKKAGIDRKRNASFGEHVIGKKTAKLTEGVGLGIGTWGTSKVTH